MVAVPAPDLDHQGDPAQWTRAIVQGPELGLTAVFWMRRVWFC